MAEKIGTGKRAVADAEKGKPSTGIAVYTAMLWALDLIDQIADANVPVLITGESGTGKEVIAQTIHQRSNRRGRHRLGGWRNQRTRGEPRDGRLCVGRKGRHLCGNVCGRVPCSRVLGNGNGRQLLARRISGKAFGGEKEIIA
jgi:hypothetical protein